MRIINRLIKHRETYGSLRFMLALVAAVSLFTGSQSIKLFGAGAKAEAVDVELHQALLDLTNPWTVMCVAAHPDDEDGATLTVLRRKMGVHTVSLFSTYGEGGQNATGPELYEELGVIRARETEEASRIQGSEPHFLALRDFGFSKSAEEALRIWGHDLALSRMVLKIRQLRPDVIITNHNTTGGHGHHQATGRLLLEAFDAAADASRFPEQLRDGSLQPWQAQRLFVRFGFGPAAESRGAEEEAARAARVVTIDRNERDPVRGTTYAEQALQALRRHASQGPWPQALPAAGWPPVRYRLVREAKGAAPLPAAPATLLDNLSLPEETGERITPLAVKALLPLYMSENSTREAVLRALSSLRRNNVFAAPAGMKDKARFQLMDKRLDRALAIASRVSAEVKRQGSSLLIPGTRTPYQLLLHNRGESDLQIRRETLRFGGRETGNGNTTSELLRSRQTLRREDTSFMVPESAVINLPQSEHLYDGHLFGEELSWDLQVEIEGAAFTLTASERFNVAPPVEIESLSPSPLVVTPQTFKGALPVRLRISNHLTLPASVKLRAGSLKNKGRDKDIILGAQSSLDITSEYTLPEAYVKSIERTGQLSATERFSIQLIKPSGPAKLTERELKIGYADARVSPAIKVGYVRSSDYTLPNALLSLGVQSKELTIDEIRSGNLSSYDTIVIDHRGYQAQPELVTHNQRLLDYVEKGGTLLVFYHKTNEWNVDAKANRPQSLSPYPIVLGNARVTDEQAPVTFAEPQHLLLNFPNKIGANDFKDWIQERGLYFPREWDKRYSAPLSMNDAGEPALQGGLLAAPYGQGHYIYTSIVWYRQLREGNPGAYRALANMLSYGQEAGK